MKENDSSYALNILGVNKNSRIFIHILLFKHTKKLRIKTVCVNLKVCLFDEENKSSVVCIHKYSQYSLITLGDTKVLSKESHTGFTAWSIFIDKRLKLIDISNVQSFVKQ